VIGHIRFANLYVQVVGQDEQQPRKQRDARPSLHPGDRVSAVGADSAEMLSVDQLELIVSDEDSGMEEQEEEEVPVELDSIVLTEATPNAATDWTWN